MSLTGSLIIYVLIWWIVFFALLPIDVNREKKQNIKGLSDEGINESFTLNGYRSLYGSSKYSSELFIHEYGKYKNLYRNFISK